MKAFNKSKRAEDLKKSTFARSVVVKMIGTAHQIKMKRVDGNLMFVPTKVIKYNSVSGITDWNKDVLVTCRYIKGFHQM